MLERVFEAWVDETLNRICGLESLHIVQVKLMSDQELTCCEAHVDVRIEVGEYVAETCSVRQKMKGDEYDQY